MELDPRPLVEPQLDVKGFLEGPSKAKTPHSILYAAEIKVFKDQHGGLEDIRKKLGFSRRKMCQLLMVDPSAWTRWMRDEGKVPPHIYRALEWFLALNEKAYTQPDLAAIFTARYKIPERSNSADSALIKGLEERLFEMQTRIDEQKKLTGGLIAGGLALIACVLTYLFIR
jgi:transcriptional regulator with XRE-family HTH domain